MLTIRSKWRLLALMLPVALVIAAVALFMGGTANNNDQAFAGTPGSVSGVTCADVWLAELNNADITEAKPAPIGDPPPPLNLGIFSHVAISVNYTQHNINTNETVGTGVVVNKGIAGVIAGTGSHPLVLCAKVDKVVATVSSITEPLSGGIAIVAIDPTGGNPPLPGMVVHWDSSAGSNEGYYVVTSTNGTTTATLQATQDLCNNTPGTGTANGSLRACVPDNKGFNPPFDDGSPGAADPISASQTGVLGYSNGQTITGGVLDPGVAPRVNGTGFLCAGGGVPVSGNACTSSFVPDDDCNGNAGTGCSKSISCTPGTGAPEDPLDPVGDWTRTEILTTAYASDTSEKTPSFGVTQFFTPVDDKTCANNANTVRSTTYNVVWSLDSAALDGDDPATDGWNSDWDKDGCLDWQELQSPQPVTLADGGGGRDAFNPYDCDRTMNGVWTVTVVKTPISSPDDGNTIVPGSFWRCVGLIENVSSMRTYCYRDDPAIDVNPEDALGEKGDGLGGSGWPIGLNGFPPAPYGDVNDTHDVLDVSYNGGADTLAISGCLEDQDGANPEGNVYWSTPAAVDVSVLTGYGIVEVWINQGLTDCQTDNPSGGSTQYPIYIGKQAGGAYADHYDSDLDGIPTSRELQDDDACGRRDPFNRYDYYDVSQPKDGVIDLPNDILGVILHFAPGGNAPYDVNWDRPPVMAGVAALTTWNRGAPDGVIDLPNDILGVILQFHPAGCGLT